MIYFNDLEMKLIIESLLKLELDIKENEIDNIYKCEITKKLRHNLEREVAEIAFRKS